MEEERIQKAYAGVIDYFRGQIMAGELKAGERIPPEREIAALLGVSRNSVREAIRIMDMMGIISSVQGSGNYITCDFQKSITETMAMMLAMDRLDFRQIGQVRNSLETLAYSLAVCQATEEEIRQMEDYVRKMDKSTDSQESVMLDKKLHYAFAAASRNVLIIDILEACSAVVHTFIENMRYEIQQTEERKGMLQKCQHDMELGLKTRDEKLGLDALGTPFKLVNQVLDEDRVDSFPGEGQE